MTPPEEVKVYSISTLALMVFKSLRGERNMTQAHIAEQLGMKTTSAWTKIENGQSPLTMDVFYQACVVFMIPASQVISITEQISFYVGRAGFYPRPTDSKQDDLLPLVREFFGKSILPTWNPYSASWHPDSILSNWPLTGEIPEVIRYCTDPVYRAELA